MKRIPPPERDPFPLDCDWCGWLADAGRVVFVTLILASVAAGAAFGLWLSGESAEAFEELMP